MHVLRDPRLRNLRSGDVPCAQDTATAGAGHCRAEAQGIGHATVPGPGPVSAQQRAIMAIAALGGAADAVERAAHRTTSPDEIPDHLRGALWAHTSRLFVQLAELGLRFSPSVDESEDGNIVAEVHTYTDGVTGQPTVLHYPADNFVEILMGLVVQPDIRAGAAAAVTIDIPEAS